MKRYLGRRELMTVSDWQAKGWPLAECAELEELGHSECHVYVETTDSAGVISERRLDSDEELNWGYGGSGPAACARAILTDYLGGPEQLPTNAFGERVIPDHQAFKWKFLARAPEAGFVIDAVEIQAWMVLEQAEDALREEAS
jgi:hypothetical protein